MRIGLIARAEDRGLGIQTWEWFRHMSPAATLVVHMPGLTHGFEPDFTRYASDHTSVVKFDGSQFEDEETVRQFLSSVDVVYTAETFYDMRLADWALEHKTKICVHVNPEFWKYDGLKMPAVRWWAPTSWRLKHLPPTTLQVPVPVPLDRWPKSAPTDGGPVFLHVAGHQAAHDRNGTRAFIAGVKQMRAPCEVRVITQDERLPQAQFHKNVRVEAITGGVKDYWDLYTGSNVLVLPRKYGGLCLPANEAAGAGLALVMTDTSPNMSWPITPLKVHTKQHVRVPGGQITLAGANYNNIAQVLDDLATDHEKRWEMQRLSRMWAEARSWRAQKHNVLKALEAAL